MHELEKELFGEDVLNFDEFFLQFYEFFFLFNFYLTGSVEYYTLLTKTVN